MPHFPRTLPNSPIILYPIPGTAPDLPDAPVTAPDLSRPRKDIRLLPIMARRGESPIQAARRIERTALIWELSGWEGLARLGTVFVYWKVGRLGDPPADDADPTDLIPLGPEYQ